jgi:hypothetical protein
MALHRAIASFVARESGRDLDAACPLEFRQQLFVRATESAGYDDVELSIF